MTIRLKKMFGYFESSVSFMCKLHCHEIQSFWRKVFGFMMQSPFEVVSGTSIQIMLVALRKIKRKSNDMRLINLLDL